MMQNYLALPEASKDTHRLDNEGFLRQGLKKMEKRFESNKPTARQLEVNLILTNISLGRHSILDDLDPELAATVRSGVDILRSAIYERLNSLTSGAAAVLPPPLAPAEAAAAGLVSSQEEPPMVANTPPFVQPPPQEPTVALSQEPIMVPPFATAPPKVAEADASVPHTLLAEVGDPLAPAAGVGVDEPDEDDGFPRGGRYLLEVADAILDDGSGHAVQATEEDVDRLLREHGLESYIKPKPM